MHKGFILLNCDLGAEEYIVDELNQMPIINHAYLTFGAYDVIAEIETDDQEGFEKVVATIDTPKSHQGILRPERKKSFKLFPAFFETRSPTTRTKMK